MKKYWALYKKEMKSIAGISIILLALTAAIVAIVYAIDIYTSTFPNLNRRSVFIDFRPWYINQFVHATVYMLPVILVYSLNSERMSKTHYLNHSLPVRNYSIIFTKLLAVMSIGFVLAFLIGLYDYRVNIIYPLELWRLVNGNDPSIPLFGYGNIQQYYSSPYLVSIKSVFNNLFSYHLFSYKFLQFCMRNLGRIFAFSCMVCAAQGVMLAIKRNKLITWAITFIVCNVLFSFLPESSAYGRYISYPNLRVWFPFFAGFVFLAIGLFLYEKYAEV